MTPSVSATSARTSTTPHNLATVVAPEREAIIQRFVGEKPTRWGLGLPGEITKIPATHKAIALTFDACGGPGGSGYDEKLINLLRRNDVKATLTFNQRWIDANPSVAAELAADPLFNIANHGLHHCPLSVNGRSAYGIRGTKNISAMYDEIYGAREWIHEHQGSVPVYFRSGTAFSDDIGVRMCAAMGMPFLGFSVNGDGGATFTKAQVVAALETVKAGDIVISHMNQPSHATAKGFREALPKLIGAGFTFSHIS